VEIQVGGKVMKIEVLNEEENPLLKRKQFEVKIIHDAATPSIEEIRKRISVSKEIGKGTIIIDSFKSQYGSKETIGTVKVYQTKERALEIEPRHRLIKNGLIEGEKKEKPKPKEEPKPEEAAEKTEEPKPEEKPKEEKLPEKKEEPKPEEVKEEKPKEVKEEPKEEVEDKSAEKSEEKPKEKKEIKKG
jgi:ribosomal protein S24E